MKNEKMKSVQIAQNGEKNGRKLVLWPPRPLNLLKIIFVFMTPQIEVKEDYIDGGYESKLDCLTYVYTGAYKGG